MSTRTYLVMHLDARVHASLKDLASRTGVPALLILILESLLAKGPFEAVHAMPVRLPVERHFLVK